eukprot:COSAG06_NODE_45649_length_353_cov_0.614173_1_plen_76_part_01
MSAVTDNSVVLIDSLVPALTGVTIASTYANTSVAGLADTVTLSFTANETIFPLTCTFQSGAQNVTGAGNISYVNTG